jgi:hypothetical protein
MKKLIFILLLCILTSCAMKQLSTRTSSKHYVYLLKDNDISKFYLNDSVRGAYENGTIINCPIIAIDGIAYQYNKNQDTIFLPQTKIKISSITFLNKNSSRVIYGKKETNGAIIINTIHLK